jgi:hypothetical protein
MLMARIATAYQGTEMLHRRHHWFWRHAIRMWMCSDCFALR